jgi:hypothetical protein
MALPPPSAPQPPADDEDEDEDEDDEPAPEDLARTRLILAETAAVLLGTTPAEIRGALRRLAGAGVEPRRTLVAAAAGRLARLVEPGEEPGS